MALSREMKNLPGIREAVVSLGTEMNLALLKDLGLWNGTFDGASPADLVLALDAESEASAKAALEQFENLLERKNRTTEKGEARNPGSLEAALKALPEANLAVISLPGAFAAREARKALKAGLHVMLFSDNVSLEEEISLKRYAREKGLLVMGPDCGTAIVNGKPLCFANAVRRGAIGVAAASGTGLQEVTSLIHEFGGGVSQAVGTGGRDLKNEAVGGLTMLMAVEALKRDPATRVIVVVSKPPSPDVAGQVIEALEESGKPCVIHFIGLRGASPESAAGLGFPPEAGSRPGFVPELLYATNLEETAALAVTLARGELYRPRTFTVPEAEFEALLKRERAGRAKGQKYLRGLFTGGTLADEALILLHEKLGGVFSNNQTDEAFLLKDPRRSEGHAIVDLGDDVYTVGRPHPMIDPSGRNERIEREAEDPETALLLLDVVLGYGSHPDPAGALLPSLRAAKKKAEARGGRLSVVASVTGTSGDFQGKEGQRKKLEEAGCAVLPSNYQAALFAARVLAPEGKA